MLRDGEFLAEPPVKIGAHYVPDFYRKPVTQEEIFMQSVILNQNPYQVSMFSKLLGNLLKL